MEDTKGIPFKYIISKRVPFELFLHVYNVLCIAIRAETALVQLRRVSSRIRQPPADILRPLND